TALEPHGRQARYRAWFGTARSEATHAGQRQGSSSRAVADDGGFEAAGPEAAAQGSPGGLEEKDQGRQPVTRVRFIEPRRLASPSATRVVSVESCHAPARARASFARTVIPSMLRKKLPNMVCTPSTMSVKPHSAQRMVICTSRGPQPS